MSKSRLIEFDSFAPEDTHKGPSRLALAHNLIPFKNGFRAFARMGYSSSDVTFTGTFNGYAWNRLVTVPSAQSYNYDIGLAFISSSAKTSVHVRLQALGSDPWHHVEDIADASAGLRVKCLRFGNYVLYKPTINSARAIATSNINTAVSATTIVGAPTMAACMVTAQRFVMMLGRTEFGVYDGWYCSARDDHTSWTLSPSTLCAKGRLTDTSGAIVAAVEFNGDIIAAKQTALYRGRFVPGSAEVWEWEKLPWSVTLRNDASDALIATKQGVVILGDSGVYLYDGASLDTLYDFSNLEQFNIPGVSGEQITPPNNFSYMNYSPSEEAVYIFRASNLNLFPATQAWICHLPTRRWSTALLNAACFAVTTVPAGGKAGLVQSGWSSGSTGGTFGTVRMLRSLFPDSDYTHPTFSPPIIITGDIGDDFADSELTEARLHGRERTGTIVCTPYQRSSMRVAYVANGDVPESGRKFDLRQIDKWHRLKFTVNLVDAASAVGPAPELYGVRLVMETASEQGED